MARLAAFRLTPRYHPRVWGGRRLAPDGAPDPIGEAWLVHEDNAVVGGPAAGQTLAGLAEQYAGALLGRRAVARTGRRFPLLVKLLDTSDWLSLQVHPNDEQARRLAGEGQFGKTEAWHFLDVAAGARVIAGLRPGTSAESLAAAIRGGGLLDLAHRTTVAAGDTVLIPAGTVHALGPGLLLYEVQQTSDLTYRVWDWDRPAAAGRALHVEESLACAVPTARGIPSPAPAAGAGVAALAECDYFALELVALAGGPVDLDPAGESFHAVTGVEGAVRLAGDGWVELLGRHETAVVPASAGPYRVESPGGRGRALLSRVP